MPTYKADGENAAFFVFNQIIARFGIPKEIVTDDGSHFQNSMMNELTTMLGFRQEHSYSFYPQANGQVKAVNHGGFTCWPISYHVSSSCGF